MQRTLSLLITIALLLVLLASCAKSEQPTPEPHYYATALQEFTENAAGKVSAVLYDLDGCGNDEMIVFDEGIAAASDNNHWAVPAEGGRIAVFDAKDGKNISTVIDPPEYGIYAHRLYISNNHHLVLYDVFEGYCYILYKYESGALTEAVELVDGCYAEDIYYSINGVECDESLFSGKLNEYGVENVAITISIGEMLLDHEPDMVTTLKDDTAEILAMTSEVK